MTTIQARMLNPVHKSDSTTSLSQLVVHDPACFFCSSNENGGFGSLLVPATPFLSCTCNITTHLECWANYVRPLAENKKVCPLCKTSLATWRQPTQEDVNEAERIQNKNSCILKVTLWLCVLCILLACIFVALWIPKPN